MTTEYEVGDIDFADIFVTVKEAEATFANKLYMWGNNYSLQLGDGTATSKSIPTQIYSNVSKIVCGYTTTFIIHGSPTDSPISGMLSAAGSSAYGILGNGSTSPVSSFSLVSDPLGWSDIATSDFAAYGIKSNNTLWTWGRYGTGTTDYNLTPVQVGTANDWKQITIKGWSPSAVLAIKQNGTLWTWGENAFGILGNAPLGYVSSPVQVGTGTNWKQVCAGNWYAIAVKNDGSLWSWGANFDGALGDNSTIHKSTPVQVGLGTNWSQVSCNPSHTTTAAIKQDGTLWTWGVNDYGQLGVNDRINRSSPVQTIAGGTNWSEVSVGGQHMLAIKTDGSLWSWGRNGSNTPDPHLYYGGLGDGTKIDKSSPVQIGIGINWSHVSAGYDNFSGAIGSLG